MIEKLYELLINKIDLQELSSLEIPQLQKMEKFKRDLNFRLSELHVQKNYISLNYDCFVRREIYENPKKYIFSKKISNFAIEDKYWELEKKIKITPIEFYPEINLIFYPIYEKNK